MIISLRKKIIRNYIFSPLMTIDGTLTEELYNNIIRKSLNPDDNTKDESKINCSSPGTDTTGQFSYYFNNVAESININKNKN